MWDNTLTKRCKHKLTKGQIVLKVCPFCEDSNYNMEVSIEKKVFHCWICDAAGMIQRLFRKLELPFEDDGLQVSVVPQEVKTDVLSLESFYKVSWKRYSKFFKSRGLEEHDIVKYNIMTTDKGKFKDKIIFPLYEGNKLVYIVGRDITPKSKYYNMNINKSNILPYYIGKVHTTVAYICEGVMDAISVNKLGYTSIVLLGTVLSDAQIRKMGEIGFSKLVVCLDGDATKKAVNIYDKIVKQGFESNIVMFNQKDDPNAVFVRDPAELKNIVKSAAEITLKDRIKIKMGKR